MDFFVSLHTAHPGKMLENEVSYPEYERQKLPRLSDEGDFYLAFPFQGSGPRFTVTHVAISIVPERAIFVIAFAQPVESGLDESFTLDIVPEEDLWAALSAHDNDPAAFDEWENEGREALMAEIRNAARGG